MQVVCNKMYLYSWGFTHVFSKSRLYLTCSVSPARLCSGCGPVNREKAGADPLENDVFVNIKRL